MPDARPWTIQGYDTFSHEFYPLPGEWGSEIEARAAAAQQLEILEKEQPTSQSGGQRPTGIQDRVFITRPDGTEYCYLPD